MKLSPKAAIFAALATVQPAQCQTPSGYDPSASNTLGVYFDETSQTVSAGNLLSASDTQTAPTLSLSSATSSSLYMVFMVDPDKRSTTDGTLSETLQWYQPDLQLSSNTLSKISTSSSAAAIYGGPAPPAGETHRYIFMLFEQPDDYVLPEEYESYMQSVVSARYFWNMTEFVEVAGVGEPVAANWFTASG